MFSMHLSIANQAIWSIFLRVNMPLSVSKAI